MADDHTPDDHTADDRRTDDRRIDDHSTGDQPAHRPWRQLAEAVLHETDHDKIVDRAQELCDAVDEQVLGHRKKTNDG
jgi:hypothetical protein